MKIYNKRAMCGIVALTLALTVCLGGGAAFAAEPESDEAPPDEIEELIPDEESSDEIAEQISGEAPSGEITVTFVIGDNIMRIVSDDGVMDVEMDVAPVTLNDRTFIPVRFAAEALRAEVKWDEETETVTISRGDVKIELVIGSNILRLTNEAGIIDMEMDVEPYTLNDRAMLPVRFISEALGCEIGWDEETETVTITDNYSSAADVADDVDEDLAEDADEEVDEDVAGEDEIKTEE